MKASGFFILFYLFIGLLLLIFGDELEYRGGGDFLFYFVRYCTVFSFIVLLYCESYIYKSNM